MAGNEIVERARSSLLHIECFYEAKDAKKRILDLVRVVNVAEKQAAEIERLQAEVERLRPRTADDLICIIRDWLGSDDATHWGQFEQQLDAALTATDEKTPPSRVVIRAGDLSDEEVEAIRNAQPGRVEALTPEVSDEMVERVARAISGNHGFEWDGISEAARNAWRADARAAIEAMR